MPLRLADMRERHDDPIPRAHQPGELVLRLAQPAGGDRGPLRLERVRLRAREQIELRRRLEVERRETVLFPGPVHVIRAPDEIRRPIDCRDEVAGNLDSGTVALVIRQRRLVEVAAALSRRVYDGGVLGVEGALGERRERADLLDLVAEELHPQRLTAGRGEDVDEAAADGELPALFHTVDPLVAGEREVLREPVDPGLLADAESERCRPGVDRRQPFAERARGRADEAARREDVERPVALPHEVRRRSEARVPADPTAREECNGPVAGKPRSAIGGIARVGVIGKQDEQRPLELGVERGEKQGKHRL